MKQDSIDNISSLIITSVLIFLLVYPKLILKGQGQEYNLQQKIIVLSKIIASDDFRKLKESNKDIALIDSLFTLSLRINRDNISEALLSLTFACLPYDNMPLTIPYINSRINIPLPAANKIIFKKKLLNLPSHFLSDSPTSNFGDMDKLPHYFGSAFIAYNFPSTNFALFSGIFIELFESVFKVEGGLDERDVIVDHLGIQFGRILREDIKYKPSILLKFYCHLFSIIKY